MIAALRSASRPLPIQLAAFALLMILLLLFLGLYYRASTHDDIAVVSAGGTAGTTVLMQKLEGLDVDYRLRKDGTILIDSADKPLLVQAGVAFSASREKPRLLVQTLLALLALLSGLLAIAVGRGVVRQLKSIRNTVEIPEQMPAKEVEYPHPRQETAPRTAANAEARIAAKLFETEHPQTVAIYLLTLEADAAAPAMEAMPPALRIQVWKRMAHSGACDAALRGRVTELFAAKMKRLRRQLRPPEVTDKMVAIFRLLSPETRNELLSMLRREETADEIVALLQA